MKRSSLARVSFAIWLAATARAAASEDQPPPVQDQQPPPSAAGSSDVAPLQPPLDVDKTPRRATLTSARSSGGDSVEAGALKGIRALSFAAGAVRVRLTDGSERLLSPGDALGDDRVTTVDEGRLVLERRGSAQGVPAGTVIVDFDGQGRGRVRVYLAADPSGARLPEKR